MTAFTFRAVGAGELDALATTRLEVLRAANELPNCADEPEILRSCRAYYEKELASEQCLTYFAYDGAAFVGCGSVRFFAVREAADHLSGTAAMIMNMYTRPAYRRQGVATRLLTLLVREARARKVCKISLEATRAGKSVYEKFGFVAAESEMVLPLAGA